MNQLTIVNRLVRRALLRTSCLGLHFEKKAARATSKKFRRVIVARCVTVPRRASINAAHLLMLRQLDRRDAVPRRAAMN